MEEASKPKTINNNDKTDEAIGEQSDYLDSIDSEFLPGEGFAWLPDEDEEVYPAEDELLHEVEPHYQSAPPKSPLAVLNKYWGYDAFREKQAEIIDSVIAAQDTLGLLPTGGGKSICFQVPALLFEGITLVVAPLISLMKDQVDQLRSRGIKAAAIHSGMRREALITTLDNCIFGRYKLLYVSPERLSSPLFLSRLDALNVSLLVIDECHCISQWGYDFRPSYLNISKVREQLPNVPVLALTATATPEVAADVMKLLGFAKSNIIQRSFYRPQLSYSIRYCNDKEAMLLHILNRVPGTAIVYCRNRQQCKDLAMLLRKQGISADFFHAGLNHTERELRQNRWTNDDLRVIVSTNAFGMGIDKPDVRLVVHMMMPSSPEEYFQEAGRVGRDGKRAYAVALVATGDENRLRRRVSDEFPPREYIERVYEAVCDSLQVGEGEGYNRSYDFEPESFLRAFRMQPIHSMSAIKILELAGIWEYHEEESRSRLMVQITRQELYSIQSNSQLQTQILTALLRSYPGLFADYVFIDELQISSKSGCSPDEVYEVLSLLNLQGILHYIPRKKIPRIVFRTRREEAKLLRIAPAVFEDRKLRLQERIKHCIDYSTSQDRCRSRILLEYFGERKTTNCGICDVCLQRNDKGLHFYIIDDLLRLLEERLKNSGDHEPVLQICNSLTHPHKQTLAAIRYLVEHNCKYRLDGEALIRN